MRIIEIDGSDWQSVKDFLTALRAAIGAPDWHGSNVNAFIDSMIWGGINQIEPHLTKFAFPGPSVAPRVERSEVPTLVVSKTTLPGSPKVLVLTGF